jgi:hypothetical protein
MLVKATTSMAGANFSYRFGQEVEIEEFKANVGNGWENLCDYRPEEQKPVVEPVVEQSAEMASPAVEPPAVEAPVVAQAAPVEAKRSRRK